VMLDLVTQVGERRARGRRHRPLHASGFCFESSLDFLSKVQLQVGAGHPNTQLNLLVGLARHLAGAIVRAKLSRSSRSDAPPSRSFATW
jgi:hypothetical protein